MKLIKLFEEFIAEAANPKFQTGKTYAYQFIDLMGKNIKIPVKLKGSGFDDGRGKVIDANYELPSVGILTAEEVYGNYAAGPNMMAKFKDGKGLDLQSSEDHPNSGIFHHPNFTAAKVLIKVDDGAGRVKGTQISAKTIPGLQNYMKDAFELPVDKWNIGQKPELSFRPNLYGGQVLLHLAYGDSKLTALNLVSNSPADHLKNQFPDKAALTQQGFKVWGEGIIKIANEGETDWAIMYKL